ncbi:MAG: hypothetical protein QOE51_1607 [Actinoplanes sp.]|jgi:hypothetical protein|nr:hypothetical protein [Actinoplanes sp.]
MKQAFLGDARTGEHIVFKLDGQEHHGIITSYGRLSNGIIFALAGSDQVFNCRPDLHIWLAD